MILFLQAFYCFEIFVNKKFSNILKSPKPLVLEIFTKAQVLSVRDPDFMCSFPSVDTIIVCVPEADLNIFLCFGKNGISVEIHHLCG